MIAVDDLLRETVLALGEAPRPTDGPLAQDAYRTRAEALLAEVDALVSGSLGELRPDALAALMAARQSLFRTLLGVGESGVWPRP